MQIICGHKLFFERGEENITVSPAPGPQEVPNWIKTTATYKAHLAAETIIEVNLAAAKPVKPVVKPVVAAAPVTRIGVPADWPKQPEVEAIGLASK